MEYQWMGGHDPIRELNQTYLFIKITSIMPRIFVEHLPDFFQDKLRILLDLVFN